MRIEQKDNNFIITDFDEMEAYRVAYKIEEKGLEFYKKLVEKVEDTKTKETLKFLIDQESDHLKFFQNCLFELRKAQEDVNEDNDLLDSLDFRIFQPYESIEDLEKVLTDFDKALKLGMIVEEKSIKFYENCQRQVSSPSAKEGIGNIIGEEYKHKALIEGLAKG